MSPITTHVLDTSLGKPAAEIEVTLDSRRDGAYVEIGRGVTDADGRIKDLISSLEPGVFRITFQTGAYFERLGVDAFYPEASIVFEVKNAEQHYHVPLLLNPFGYSTYRGS